MIMIAIGRTGRKKEVCTQLKEQKRVLTVCNSNKKEMKKIEATAQ